MKVFYIDIDGTLTNTPQKQWGVPEIDRINKVKELIKISGNIVVIWSSGGWGYALAFCVKYGINPTAILPKPDYIVDDIPSIRTPGKITYLTPKNFFKK